MLPEVTRNSVLADVIVNMFGSLENSREFKRIVYVCEFIDLFLVAIVMSLNMGPLLSIFQKLDKNGRWTCVNSQSERRT